MAQQAYAKGKWAVGECARSGRKMLLRDMIADGYYPNLIVDPDWYEPKHPQESLPSLKDPTALYRPAPERDQSGASLELGGSGSGSIIGSDGQIGTGGGGLSSDPVPGGGFGASNNQATGSLSYGYEIGSPTIGVELAPPNLIFVDNAGDFYIRNVDGDGQPVPLPNREAGDDLLLISAGRGSEAVIVESGVEWTLISEILDFEETTLLSIHHRVATNDANDVATYNDLAGSLNAVAQICTVKSSLGGSFSVHSSGPLNNANSGGSTDWNISTFPVGGGDPNNTFILGFWLTQTFDQEPSPTLGNATDLQLIDQIVFVDPSSADSTIWFGWGWRFDSTPAVVTGVQQTYSPLRTNRDQATRYIRWTK